MAWKCRYLRDENATWFPSETKLDTRLYECAADNDGGGAVIEPEIQPPVTFTPSPPAGIEGLDPMAPGGPGQNRTWSEQVLAFLFGDDDEAVTPKAPASAGGCCPNGQPRCLRCWLKKNAGWLFIAGLAFAAFLLRKRP